EGILAALAIENRRVCEPPLPPDELEHIARNVGRYQPEQEVVERPDGVEYLELGSENELADLLLEELEPDDAPELVYDQDQLYRYDVGAGIWSPVAQNDVAKRLVRYDGIPIRPGGALKVKGLIRVSDKLFCGVW